MYALWQKCYRALRNRTNTYGTSGYSPNMRLPEIWPIVRQSVGFVMDQRIIMDASPASTLGTEWHQYLSARARDIEVVMESTATVNQEELELQKMLWDADTYGTGFLKSQWDNTLVDGKGDALLARLNPFFIYPDPAAMNFDECDHIFEARPMSLIQLDRRFPGAMEMFLDGAANPGIDEPPSQLNAAHQLQARTLPAAASGRTTPNWTNPSRGQGEIRPTDTVIVLECWLREHDVEISEDGTMRVQDAWRCVIIAGEYVLFNERATDLWSHGSHPYSRYVPHDLGEFWGIGLVELLGPAQAGINRLLAAIQRNIELTGDPQLVEASGAGTQRAALADNRPGTRQTKRQGMEYYWMEPPSFSFEPRSLIEFILQRMEVISGVTPITKGQVSGGRPSGDVVDAMQEAAHVATRERLRNLEATLREAYTRKASLIAENYTEPRFVSITGPEGRDTAMMLAGRHFMRPTPDGNVPLEYQIRVDAGSSQQTSRRMFENDVVTRFTLGLYDPLTALERLNEPNPQQTAERLGIYQQLQGGGPTARQRARA